MGGYAASGQRRRVLFRRHLRCGVVGGRGLHAMWAHGDQLRPICTAYRLTVDLQCMTLTDTVGRWGAAARGRLPRSRQAFNNI